MEKAFGVLSDQNIFDERSIFRDGAVMIVRPDQYVAGIFPLDETQGLEAFLNGVFPAVRAVSLVS